MTEQMQHPTNVGPFFTPTVYAAKELATPMPPQSMQIQGGQPEPAKPETKPTPPEYGFAYFHEDGQISRTYGNQPDTLLMQQAYLVMVSVPRGHNAAPYLEIIKSRYGSASVIMTANFQIPPPIAIGECRGGDYCDDTCPGPGQCGGANA